MNRLKSVIAGFLILLVSSVASGFGISLYINIYDNLNSDRNFVWQNTFEMSLAFGFMAFPFIAIGTILIGVPTLFLARNEGWNKSASQAFWVGGIAGGLGGLTLLGLIIPVVSLFGAGAGFVSGSISGLLWWHWFEKSKFEKSND